MDYSKPGELRGLIGDAENAVVPEGVKWICDQELQYLDNLRSVKLPSSLKTIGRKAFHCCPHLSSITVPDSVTWIGDNAFAFCSSLVEIELPSSVKEIGDYAFSACSSLRRVAIAGPIHALARGMFMNCYDLQEVVLPGSIRYIGGDAFYGCGKVTITLPDDYLKTTDQLDTSLCRCLPDDVDTMAHVLAFQQGKSWANAVGENAKSKSPEVLERAIALLANEEKVNAKVAANLVGFALDQANRLEEEHFQALRRLVSRGSKRRTKALSMLEEDPRSAMFFNVGGRDLVTVESKEIHPAEALVAQKMVWDKVSLKLKQKLKKGVKFAASDETSSPDVLNYIISAYARITPDRVHITVEPGNRYVNVGGYGDYRKAYWQGPQFCPEADEIAEALDGKDLVESLGELVGESLWDLKSLVPEALTAYARYADDAHAGKLISHINKWVKGRTWHKKGAVIARGALLLNDTKTAMVYLDSIGALGTYARLRGVNEAVLRDTRLSEFGFDEDGRRVFDLGDFTVTVTLADDLTLRLVNDATGKVIKSIPKRGADPQLYESAQAELADMKKNIKKVVFRRKDELFKDFLYGKKKNAADWESSFIGNPVLRNIACLLVWQQGKQTFTVRGREIVDALGKPVVLAKTGIVLAHPMNMDPAEVAAWQNYLLAEKLRQPFQQMWEPVVNLSAIEPDRYNGIKIRAYLLRGKDKHGIHLKAFGFNSDYQIRFDDCVSEVVYHSMQRHAVSQDDWCDVRSIEVARQTRMSNHIIGYLDRCALYAGAYMCIADDDEAALEPLLEQLDLAKTIDLLNLASEKGATKVAARLLDYKDTQFPEATGVGSLELE